MTQGTSKPAGKTGISWLRSRMPVFTAGSFASNSMFTSARSLVMILAQLIFTPIIVKLYDPEAYGTFGLVFSISTLLLSVFTLQYDNAILLATKEADVRGLQAVSNALPFYLSAFTFVLLLFVKDPLLGLLNAQAIGNAVYLIPLLVILGAWSQTSHKLVQVRYRYKEGFIYGSAVVVGAKLTTIAYGLLVGSHFLGLALAEFFSRLAYHIINYRVILNGEPLLRWTDLNLKRHFWVLRKYISFPRYDLPATLLNATSNQFPILWISRFFGLAQLGQFTLAMGLLEMPMRLFGYSLSNTFYQKAARVMEQEGRTGLRRITQRMMLSIGGVSVIPLLIIGLFAEPVFIWVFGEKWALSGSLSSILSMYYFARLVVEPVVPVLRVLKAQRHYFRFQAILFILRCGALGGALATGMDLLMTMFLYALVNALAYGTLAVHILALVRKREGT